MTWTGRSIIGLIGAFAAAAVVVSACETPAVPGDARVVGAYSADLFEHETDDGETIDLLAAGSEVTITIAGDRTFTSSFVAPAALSERPAPVEVTGDWTFTDGVLSLHGSPATFLDQVGFTVPEGGVMYGLGAVYEGIIRLRLVEN